MLVAYISCSLFREAYCAICLLHNVKLTELMRNVESQIILRFYELVYESYDKFCCI